LRGTAKRILPITHRAGRLPITSGKTHAAAAALSIHSLRWGRDYQKSIEKIATTIAQEFKLDRKVFE